MTEQPAAAPAPTPAYTHELGRYHLWRKSDMDVLAMGGLADESRFARIGDVVIRTLGAPMGDGCWARLLQNHRILVDAVAAGEPVRVAACLADIIRNNVGYGMTWSRADWERMVAEPAFRTVMIHGLKDYAWSLAEALGVISAENPAAGDVGKPIPTVASLCDAIDRFAGMPLLAPPCFSVNFGLKRPGGVLDHRAMWAFLTSNRLFQLLRLRGIAPADAHILEIGGGVGNLARHCLQRGIGRYTIVDIPTVRAIQTYMAMYEFPDLEIGFDEVRHRLNLLLPDGVGQMAPGSVTIVVNEDSLPEMAQPTAMQYLAAIPCIARGGLFLSVNHEGGQFVLGHRHSTVPHLAGQVPQLSLLSRSRHWMRRGYVEEVYAVG